MTKNKNNSERKMIGIMKYLKERKLKEIRKKIILLKYKKQMI